MKNLITALISAQKQFKPIKKDTKAYNYKYAPLDMVRDCTIDALNNNGLTIIQMPICLDDKIGVKTILAHESGETIEQEFLTHCSDLNPQKIGSLITYYRRYSWLAILGCAPEDEDDDASSYCDNNKQKKAFSSMKKNEKIDENGINFDKALINLKKTDSIDNLAAQFKYYYNYFKTDKEREILVSVKDEMKSIIEDRILNESKNYESIKNG